MNPIIIHHRGLGVLEERLTVYPGPLRFTPGASLCFACTRLWAHMHVSMHTQSVCPCLPSLCVHARLHYPCTRALHPGIAHTCLQGIVGPGPTWRPLQRPVTAFPGGPRTLTQGPSLQLEQAVRLESGELETQEPRGLARQSVELRRQLQEEQASYRRKLQAYQEGQQRQAQLVQRLQAKVRATHSCFCPPLRSLGPAPMPLGLTGHSPPIPRFSSTRRRPRRWRSSCWREPRSWSSGG